MQRRDFRDEASRFFRETGETERSVGFGPDGPIKKKGPFYELNPEFRPQLKDEQEAAQLLVEVIRFWREKIHMFCYQYTPEREGDLPEYNWRFGYKTPSTCGRCVMAQNLLDKIFGDRSRFNALPFVTYEGDRFYSFSFEMLKYFAENGYEATVRLINERKKDKLRKAAEEELEKQRRIRAEKERKLAEKLGGRTISEELRQQIIPYADNKSLVIVSPNIAVVQTFRSEWGSSGGIGYYDQVRVFCGSQSEMREWQWRDRYSASNDKPWLAIDEIGNIKISEGEKVTVEVELVNKKYGNRTVTFTFDPPKPDTSDTSRKLSEEKQKLFLVKVEEEILKIMNELNRLWECKPKMLNPYSTTRQDSEIPYRQPFIKQKEVHPEIGVAAFVTAEQIDHRGTDPQMRYTLFVVTEDNKQAEAKAEDHGYEREGGAFLKIIEVTAEHFVINTKEGKKTIKIK